MTVVLGVDGGTSKTKALIAAADGTILGHARTGGSNIYEGNPEDGMAQAMLAPEQALAVAGLPAAAISHAVFSMSGADWPEDMVFFRAAARAKGFGQSITVVNDAIGGLRAGLPGPEAVGVICGTHAACAARNANGDTWHNSFWQLVGGGHDLGSAALKAVYMADLGIAPPTSLTEAVLRFYGQPEPAALLHRQTALMHEPYPSPALLAPTVLDHADQGDEVALEIVNRQGTELGRFGIAAARKVGIDAHLFDLVLGGSIFRHHSRVLVDAIATEMRRYSPDLRVIFRSHEPVVGALLLALEAAGTAIDDAVLARIVDSLPEGWY